MWWRKSKWTRDFGYSLLEHRINTLYKWEFFKISHETSINWFLPVGGFLLWAGKFNEEAWCRNLMIYIKIQLTDTLTLSLFKDHICLSWIHTYIHSKQHTIISITFSFKLVAQCSFWEAELELKTTLLIAHHKCPLLFK